MSSTFGIDSIEDSVTVHNRNASSICHPLLLPYESCYMPSSKTRTWSRLGAPKPQALLIPQYRSLRAYVPGAHHVPLELFPLQTHVVA